MTTLFVVKTLRNSRGRSVVERIRKRVAVGIGALLFALVAFTKPRGFEHGVYEAFEMFGFFLIFVAVLGRIWCALYISGRKNRELCRAGPYAFCRNPLYCFSFVGLLGICLGAQSLLAAVFALPLFAIYYWLVVRSEERRLSQLFGPEYTAYRKEVPRFWPKWTDPPTCTQQVIDARLFVRVLGESLSLLSSVILIEVIEHAKYVGVLPLVEVPW